MTRVRRAEREKERLALTKPPKNRWFAALNSPEQYETRQRAADTLHQVPEQFHTVQSLFDEIEKLRIKD